MLDSGHNTVFLVDVDNTLLDNDRFSSDLDERLERDFGSDGQERYRQHYEALRDELGYADYLGAVQRFRGSEGDESAMLQLANFILEYPFKQRLFTGALDVIDYLNILGKAALLSDGDMVLQPRKVITTGLWAAVEGRVSIFTHKELRIESIMERWPSKHYVLVEDKALLLDAMKRAFKDRITTVLVRQGHYAKEPPAGADLLPPDMELDTIAELRNLSLQQMLDAARHPVAPQP